MITESPTHLQNPEYTTTTVVRKRIHDEEGTMFTLAKEAVARQGDLRPLMRSSVFRGHGG
jgi:hypothetical protein